MVLGVSFFVLGKPMAVLVIQLGGWCIAAGLIFTGVRGLLSGGRPEEPAPIGFDEDSTLASVRHDGKEPVAKPTSPVVAVASILIGLLIGLGAFFAPLWMFPER